MAPRTKRRQQPVKQDIFEILYCRDEVLTNAKGDFADKLNEQLSTNHSQTSFKKKCFVAILLIAVIIFILCIPKY